MQDKTTCTCIHMYRIRILCRTGPKAHLFNCGGVDQLGNITTESTDCNPIESLSS